MVEHVRVNLGNDEMYDELLKGTLPEDGQVHVVTKDAGTTQGRPCVMITFGVQLPDGKMTRAQCVITGRNFAVICAAFRGRYGADGDSVQTVDKVN